MTAMNTVIVDPNLVVAAPSPAGPSVLVLDSSICHLDALLRSTLLFRTRFAISADARATDRMRL